MQVGGGRPDIAQRRCINACERAAEALSTAWLDRADITQVRGGTLSEELYRYGTARNSSRGRSACRPVHHCVRVPSLLRSGLLVKVLSERDVGRKCIEIGAEPGLRIAERLTARSAY